MIHKASSRLHAPPPPLGLATTIYNLVCTLSDFSLLVYKYLRINMHIIVKGLFFYKNELMLYILFCYLLFFFTQDRITKSFHVNTYRTTSFFSMATEHRYITIYLTSLLLSNCYLTSDFSPSQRRLQGTPYSCVLAYLWEFFCGRNS